MKTIQLDDAILKFLASKAVEIGEPASNILRRELGLPPLLNSILVDDDVYAFLVSKIATVGESASDIVRRELGLAPGSGGGNAPDDGGNSGGGNTPPPISGPRVVEFHIPAGTAGSAWNTRETPVTGSVGDTLRIFNDDAVTHRLHTNGKPFPHQAADILPGGSVDLVLQTPIDPAVDGPLYDHDFSTTAQFFIKVSA